ncbi:MAG TPA: hypothetical protein VFL85_04115 [Candidatus Saccharimonadales bacterium]|nr:hypothetical protein [Candidatus Saccharimonadales bacterium]
MNYDDMITDLKQFIYATVSQATADLATKDDLAKLEAKLTADIQEVKDAINDTVFPYIETVGDQVQNHEKRLKKLEKHAA